MQPFHEYILAIGAFQGLILFLLLVTDGRTSGTGRLLGVLCLFLGLFLCVPFLLEAGPDGRFFWLLGWIFYLPASIGGISYLYCRNTLLAEKFSVRQLVHLAPLLVCYLLVADYIAGSPEQLAQWIYGGNYSSFRLALSEYVLFAQAFFYLPFTLRLVSQYKYQANNKLANLNPNTFRWLWLFLILSLCVWLLKAVFAFSNTVLEVVYYGSDVMIVVLIYAIAAAHWRYPQVFTIHPHGEERLAASLTAKPKELGKSEGILAPDSREQLLALVKDKVEASELFKDSDLTLARLADATGLNPHHLSEVLNQQAGQNFYQFINSYRVDYVCSLLRQDHKSRVLDIALDAGFSSKSTFNSIFKQFKNITPSEYRKNA